MNKVILMGRLTKDPTVKMTTGETPVTAARYTLAVDRRGRRNQGNQNDTDFISVIAYDKRGDFASKYFKKGMRVLVTGHIHTYSYLNSEGTTVYATDVVAEDQEFADGRREDGAQAPVGGTANVSQDFGEYDEDDGLPFN